MASYCARLLTRTSCVAALCFGVGLFFLIPQAKAQNSDMQQLLQEKADAMAADINQRLQEQTGQALQDLQGRLAADQPQEGGLKPTSGQALEPSEEVKALRERGPRITINGEVVSSPLQEQESQNAMDNAPVVPAPSNAELAPVASPELVPTLAPDNAVIMEGQEDAFYDANDLVPVPQSEMARRGTMRPVNPRAEPASRMIIVKEDHGKNSMEARLVAAERALKLGMPESALEIYEDLRVRHKTDPNVLYGLAMTQQRLGFTESAIKTYEILLDRYPDHLEARINMLGLMSELYPAVALRNLSELMEENPDNVGVMAQAAIIHARLGHYQEALNLLGMAASMEPKNATHLFNMAVIADRGQNHEKAIEFYEKALEVDTLYGGGSIPRDTVFSRLAQLR